MFIKVEHSHNLCIIIQPLCIYFKEKLQKCKKNAWEIQTELFIPVLFTKTDIRNSLDFRIALYAYNKLLYNTEQHQWCSWTHVYENKAIGRNLFTGWKHIKHIERVILYPMLIKDIFTYSKSMMPENKQ